MTPQEIIEQVEGPTPPPGLDNDVAQACWQEIKPHLHDIRRLYALAASAQQASEAADVRSRHYSLARAQATAAVISLLERTPSAQASAPRIPLSAVSWQDIVFWFRQQRLGRLFGESQNEEKCPLAQCLSALTGLRCYVGVKWYGVVGTPEAYPTTGRMQVFLELSDSQWRYLDREQCLYYLREVEAFPDSVSGELVR